MDQITTEEITRTFNQALTFLTKGNLDEAQNGFELVIKNNPQMAEAFLNLGNVFFMREQHDKAITNFDKSIELDPTLIKGYMNLGSCYFKLSKYEEAVNYWNIAYHLSQSNALLNRNLAVAYEKLGDMQKAFKHYEEFLKYNRKNDKDALKIQRKVQESKTAAYHNLNVGITLQKQKKWNAAQNAYEKSISIYPNFSKAHLNLGSIYYKNENLDSAISSWEKALKIEPDHANTHCNLGIAYDKKNMIDEACYHYKKYLELTNGKSSDAQQVNTRYLEILEKLKEKRELVRQHVNKGNTFFNQKKYEDAIEEYKKYLFLNPTGADVTSVKERIDEAQTRLNPIEKARNMALKMGDDYLAVNLYDKAIAAYNRYLSLNPPTASADEVRVKIKLCHKQIGSVVSAMLQGD